MLVLQYGWADALHCVCGVEEVWEPCACPSAVEVFAHKTPTANGASCLIADTANSTSTKQRSEQRLFAWHGWTNSNKTDRGDRVLAVLCYLILSMAVFLGITLRYSVISVIPIWIIIVLICYFAVRKRPFVRFHFMQSQIFVILTVIIFIGASIFI